MNLKYLYFRDVLFDDSFQVPIATLSRLSQLGFYNCKGIIGKVVHIVLSPVTVTEHPDSPGLWFKLAGSDESG